MLDFDSKGKSWFHYLGRYWSAVFLIVIVGMCVNWKCRKHAQKEARPTSLNVTCTDPENLNVLHTKKGATRSFEVTDLGWKAVGIQGSGWLIKKVSFNDQMKCFESSALLVQLEKLGINVSAHCRTMRSRHLALSIIDFHPIV